MICRPRTGRSRATMMVSRYVAVPVWVLLAIWWGRGLAMAAEGMRVGVDANYAAGMEAEGRAWRWAGQAQDLYEGMAAAGVESLRVRVWTGEDGPHGTRAAEALIRRAVAAGLDPYPVIFLSDDWADLVKQPAPAMWRELELEPRREAVREYSRELVVSLRAAGLVGHRYEIGNEVDYGICGVYPGKSTKKNPESLSRRCWPDAATLMVASQKGVLEADPEARFLIHIAHWWDAEFCIAFFRFMLDQGVRVDEVGLSYFPSANIGGSLELEQCEEVLTKIHAAIGRPIVIAETAYPSTREFTGQFSRWKRETPGYPLSPDGQRRWVAAMLAMCRQHPAVTDVYYWSPEWYGEGMWKAFALFDVEGEARPAWASFGLSGRGHAAARGPVYLEVMEGGVAVVPVAEARAKAREALREELSRHGGVTVDYIAAITERELRVKGYRVNLRASLTGNLDLVALPQAAGERWRDAVAGLDGRRDSVVVFCRDGEDPLVAEVVAAVEARGLEVAIHPLAAGSAIRFGDRLIQSESAGAEPP